MSDDKTDRHSSEGNGPSEVPEESPSSESELALDNQAAKLAEEKKDQ